MASPTQQTWIWANFEREWRTGKPGVLQSMGSQSQTWLSNQTTTSHKCVNFFQYYKVQCKHEVWCDPWSFLSPNIFILIFHWISSNCLNTLQQSSVTCSVYLWGTTVLIRCIWKGVGRVEEEIGLPCYKD